ncbi:hypothetical protein HZA43_00265 [Candidatus Peregrinibacteria bacterium]|nr:hypothetical protein [Candidatus Peregrinibacteria bacterium]
MRKKIIFFLALLIIALLTEAGLVWKNKQKINKKVDCCLECLQGAARDVRGMDIGGSDCLFYEKSNVIDAQGNPEVILSPACVKYFKQSPTTVKECRLSIPSS